MDWSRLDHTCVGEPGFLVVSSPLAPGVLADTDLMLVTGRIGRPSGKTQLGGIHGRRRSKKNVPDHYGYSHNCDCGDERTLERLHCGGRRCRGSHGFLHHIV